MIDFFTIGLLCPVGRNVFRVIRVDKYEYKARADEIIRLVNEKQFREAIEIADTIDWRNVQDSNMLCTVSDLYKMCRRFEDSRDVLLLAYQRNPKGALIIYSLCDLSIMLDDVVNAIEYYKEYLQVAPKDSGRYILQYKIYEAQGASLEERISILEELQKREPRSKWMYKLAYLYHRVGLASSCVEECNQIVIYFGRGKYVIKALELKRLHEPLDEDQELLYKNLIGHIEDNITIQDVNVSQYNTIDLQKELADSLKEVLGPDMGAPAVEPDEPTTVIGAVREEAPAAEPEKPEFEESEASANVEEEHFEEAPLEEETIASENVEVLPEEEPEVEESAVTEEPVEEEPAGETEEIPEEESKEEIPISFSEIADPDIKEITPDGAYEGSEPSLEEQYDHFKAAVKTEQGEQISFLNPEMMVKSPLDDILSLEGDGQLSLIVPDQVKVEKQITGQLSIDEVLAEYDRIRLANERKWSNDISRRIKASTGDLLKNFDETSHDGLLEELEQSIEENPDSVEYGPNLTEEEKIYLEDELKAQNGELEEEIIIEEEPAEAGEGSEEEEDIKIYEKPEEDVEEEPTAEELSFDRTPFIHGYDAPAPELTVTPHGPEPESMDNTAILSVEESDYLARFAQASEEKDREEKEAIEAFEQAMKQMMDEENEQEPEVPSEEEASEEEPVEEVTEEPEKESAEEASEEETVEEPEEPVEESVEEPAEEQVEEVPVEEVKEEVEEVAEEATEEGSEEVVKEEAEESFEEKQEEVAETEQEEAEKAEESPEASEDSEEDPEPINTEDVPHIAERTDDFTEDQWDRFESYLQTEFGREQIKDALLKITDKSNTGNVIIGSSDTDSAVELGKELIVEQSRRGAISGKAAKIKASSLNAKDAKATLAKVYDGAIIIQDAEELRKETLIAIRDVVSVPDKKMLVILTASHRQKHRFIMENNDLLESFTVSIDIEALDNAELVRLATDYAYEKEFSIDEMGSLALHRRIDERQTNSHSVTLKEVKEIVDEAISHASKKNMGHFFDILLGKRYDGDGMTILGEKDFML